MQNDVHELRTFYQRHLGGIVRRLLTAAHSRPLAQRPGLRLVGLGFGVPYIGVFRGEATMLGALMPATQGALVWPLSGPVLSVMVDEALLPLRDASVDRLLCVHCLEVAERVGPLLREMWRVLARRAGC